MKNKLSSFMVFLILVVVHSILYGQPPEKNLPPEHPQFFFKPSKLPDRLLLTWSDCPLTTATVTWRTDTTRINSYAEIAIADPSPEFHRISDRYKAKTKHLISEFSVAAYHTVTFKNLKSDTYYAYRVGAGNYWTEWNQFKTPKKEIQSFSFIYIGDAQNNVFSRYSRVIRAAYKGASDAKFILYAGDLVNHSQNDYEWGEWFEAAGFIHRMLPVIAVPGNHEYVRTEGQRRTISPVWQLQFNYPPNGPPGMEDMVYYIDYKNTRIISLSSLENHKIQAEWLKKVLKENSQKWTIVMFHHPVISASEGRFNKGVLENWKPILDKYKVDLVLQGHDHSYGRGQNIKSGMHMWDEDSGTVYIVSVAGTKMYNLSDHNWMDRKAENTQFYHIVYIDKSNLVFKTMTANGKVYDAFELEKNEGHNNILYELPFDIKEERRFENTLVRP